MSSEKVKADNCTSCGIRVKDTVYASFLCPNCGEVPIARCKNCKNQSLPYECSECGFRGP